LCLQLALFHAVFTWLTLRMFGVHFVYVSTVAAAAAALLPLIPSWLVAVPAALQLIIQARQTSLGNELARVIVTIFQ
jgi:predicted PurR-regulated permease PerM